MEDPDMNGLTALFKIAEMLGEYHNKLMEQGFTREEATELACQMQETIMTMDTTDDTDNLTNPFN